MKKQPKSKQMDRDTHIYMDTQMWGQLEAIAVEEDRSITATVRVLIKEAMAARGAK